MSAHALLLVCDELARLYSNLSKYRGQDGEFWLQCWNGDHYIVERQGRPPVLIDHLLVGITGGFQPDKIRNAAAKNLTSRTPALCRQGQQFGGLDF